MPNMASTSLKRNNYNKASLDEQECFNRFKDTSAQREWL
jgi:hypothetical protein